MFLRSKNGRFGFIEVAKGFKKEAVGSRFFCPTNQGDEARNGILKIEIPVRS